MIERSSIVRALQGRCAKLGKDDNCPCIASLNMGILRPLLVVLQSLSRSLAVSEVLECSAHLKLPA